jgi:hypothetical protein
MENAQLDEMGFVGEPSAGKIGDFIRDLDLAPFAFIPSDSVGRQS